MMCENDTTNHDNFVTTAIVYVQKPNMMVYS